MGRFIDFAVKWDSKTETKDVLVKRIFNALFLQRLKGKKPVVIFVSGDSGEGKSESALKIQEILCEMQGLDPVQYVDNMNVYTPLEYAHKLDALLFDKELKKLNILCTHEAREVVKAKNWQSFLSTAVSDVNAMSRAVKRICFITVSQFIRDITTDIRYTLNYYITINRPLGHKARMQIMVMWKDDSDLEKPKLRKRKIRGYIISPSGTRRLFSPTYIELSRPSKAMIEKFEQRDYDAKAVIIRKKLEKLVAEMKIEYETLNTKVEAMVEHYSKNPESLNLIGRRVRGKWKITDEVRRMHDLSNEDIKEFQNKLNLKFGGNTQFKNSDSIEEEDIFDK
ncbi:MAG: thymidylate kinase [Siphoviridae sp. ctjeG17]|nr:MAG: thymidylate kinase [Siphoviridae sp. ctjeG17]